MTMIYNDPANAQQSTVGTQLATFHYYKKALVEAAKEQYFSQLADVRGMPKNMGKTIKQFHYLPILDDANVNDQGLNALGLATSYRYVITTTPDAGAVVLSIGESDVSAALAQTAAEAKALVDWGLMGFDTSSGVYATVLALVNTAHATDCTTAATTPAVAGNLYGSSKDVGTIAGKIPALSETGGRVNRVGMRRIELEGNIEKFGFFDEYTQESMDFDSDSELEMHITVESVKAANEITEDQLQIDLLNGAGVIRYTGAASATAELQGNDADWVTGGNTNDVVSYDDFVKLAIELDNNRCPKHTTIITGSRLVDTKVINGARYMYVGSELIPSLMRLTDYHGNKAFIPVAQYAAAGNVARGEVGAVHDFRIIQVPEMMKWSGAGAVVTTNGGFHETNGRFDVFPMLVVGDAAFTTIGFQTDGKSVKFKITHKKPGRETADRTDPYGETGFYSIKWYYGTMLLRTERIACVKTIAEI